ncbi:MAG: hypothetical protein LC723_12290 [Actinobacteria bacterium]|nr:hypothetical protein [Actinomycetota bacterium]
MEVSAEFAVMAYDALGDDGFAEIPDLPGVDALQASARWALTTGDLKTGLQLLNSSTDRRILSAARDTMVYNASRENGARFGREYNGNGKCTFCPMLASRGAVYLSADSAGEATQFHDGCHCTIYVERP